MRVLIAPDEFKGTLTGPEAAHAIARGWLSTAPDDVVTLRPMSDGGPGFLDVVTEVGGGSRVPVEVRGPLAARVRAEFVIGGETAYIESARACGIALVPSSLRDPCRATSYGVGELMMAAVETGARRLFVGLGGTAVTDGGAGMLAALGAHAFDAAGESVPLDQGGVGLVDVARVDVRAVQGRLGDVKIIVATDVDAPLLGEQGAAHGFAPQKGATPDDVHALEEALGRFCVAAGGEDLASAPGAGAAGGLGFGLMLLGAQRVGGIDAVREIVALDACIAQSDLVITGEGCFDWQSLRGKVVAGVAAAALAQARPVIVLAGRVEVGRRESAAIGVTASYAVVEPGGAPEPRDPADALADLAAAVAGGWTRA